ncbi:formylmethanofuran dehydrogenase subunit A [Acetomicrobium hydrogeniformans]|uniref:Formylmethanofuran dehydrogenase subunit A n=1 Tax=Acetomicrobium hydrogeniformans TaxID=649746 RepID=A0A7V6ZCU2_9BACT|nr:formylmethanofuran dehydrogenase subunit A [Acetomicrobium hydrogeniformans]HHZ03625.1 formylmethanofuran dehydrogenase subunit A [Acetomicrobium hydrogeniformans]
MLVIKNGRVYDPINGVKGEIRDIYIEGGKIVGKPEHIPKDTISIDADGMIVMPGGIDMHAHIAGSKVNMGRKLCPEDHYEHFRIAERGLRSGVGSRVPTTFMTAYRYVEMGYTTVVEAASAPLVTRHTHEELRDMPSVDKAILITMGNNEILMDRISQGKIDEARDIVAWLLKSTGGYGVKVVNPGGVENWKWGGNVESWDDEVRHFDISSRKLINTLVTIVDELKLPHSVHLHGINLGLPGNADTTAEIIKDIPGRLHLCHLQFMSYGRNKKGGLRSDAWTVAEVLNGHPNVTMDVGQIVFGNAVTMTSDGPLEYRIQKMTGHKWCNDDVECETGGGIVPLEYKIKSVSSAVQWITGMELFLLTKDPWQLALTTDHPNAGPFFCYPQVVRLLMDKDYRDHFISLLPPKAFRGSVLRELNREYTLYEIAIITRAAPAKILGLPEKGHLGIGADGDVAVYDPNQFGKRKCLCSFKPCRRALDFPSWVIKGGEIVVRDGAILRDIPGVVYRVNPSYDGLIVDKIREDFERYYTLSFDNYPVQEEYLKDAKGVACQ